MLPKTWQRLDVSMPPLLRIHWRSPSLHFQIQFWTFWLPQLFLSRAPYKLCHSLLLKFGFRRWVIRNLSPYCNWRLWAALQDHSVVVLNYIGFTLLWAAEIIGRPNRSSSIFAWVFIGSWAFYLLTAEKKSGIAASNNLHAINGWEGKT